MSVNLAKLCLLKALYYSLNFWYFCSCYFYFILDLTYVTMYNKKAQLSLTNPRDACEKFARFT